MHLNEKLGKWIIGKFGNVNRAAIELGEHPITIHRYISGTNMPGAPFLMKLLHNGCDLNWLFGEENVDKKWLAEVKELQEENIRLRKELDNIKKKLAGLI